VYVEKTHNLVYTGYSMAHQRNNNTTRQLLTVQVGDCESLRPGSMCKLSILVE
jgi:hypothetical protein